MQVLEVSARDKWRERQREAGRLLGTCTRDMWSLSWSSREGEKLLEEDLEKNQNSYSSLLVHTKGHSFVSSLSPIHQDGCFGEKYI